MEYEYECMVCGKGIPEEDIFHIEEEIGHFECFQKAITEYITLKDKVKRRNKQIKNLKIKLKKLNEQVFIYGTYNDQIEFTNEDIKKLDKLSRIE